MAPITVKVVGVGLNAEVTVESGTPVSEILSQAGADSDALQARVGGEAVSGDAPVEENATLQATPSNVKLGY